MYVYICIYYIISLKFRIIGDPWVAQRFGALPLAQGAILETRRAPGAWSLLLPLPVSLPLSLSL